jgi:methyl-accepting chemotaxis protein
MKKSIRTKFSLGLLFLFIIILVLSVFSGYYLNILSEKTEAILKENYLSLVYARDMSEGIVNINQEITKSFMMKVTADSSLIKNQLEGIEKALNDEKNNITEPGEEKLVSDIETGLSRYQNSVMNMMKAPDSSENILLFLQNNSGDLYQKLDSISQINGNAMETKTEEAKAASKKALTQMTVLASICFLIAFSFIFSFASYFNQRFLQLYNGIKEIVSSNYDERLVFEGRDEFYEISLVFNEMAEKLKKTERKMSVPLQNDLDKEINSRDIIELKKILSGMKSIEQDAEALISRFENR